MPQLLYVTLMDNFDKIFGLTFHNSFLKIKLNCDKENMLISKKGSFQKNILPNLTCVLIYSLILKTAVF